MATTYSLICFGGKGTTKTVTFGSSNLVTLTNHGLRDGTGVQFSGGTLPTQNGGPTALAADTTYYAKSISSSTFELYTEAGLANKILFNNNDSGTIYIKSAYYAGLADKSRWTYSTVEYIFDSLASWRTHRFTTVPTGTYDTEYCEIGMAWDDWVTSAVTLNIPCAQTYIVPTVDGVETEAGHNGVYGAGYIVKTSAAFAVALTFSGNRHTIKGVSVYTATNDADLISVTGYYNEVNSLFVYSSGTTGTEGIRTAGAANKIINNVVAGVADGIYHTGYSGAASVYANNLVTKCTNGFVLQSGGSEYRGWWYNNVSVGNTTTNWGAAAPAHSHGMSYNYGPATGNAPWGTNAVATMVADNTHFVDYAGNNFHPTSASPTKDASIVVLDMAATDIAGDVRPNYNNGGATAWDGGPFEYDNGYGLAPASGTLAGSGLVNGSQVSINKQSDGTEIVNGTVSGTTKSDAYTGANVAVYVYVRKGSAAPFHQPVRIAGSIVDGNLNYDLTGLQGEDIAAATYNAQIDTDWGVNWATGAITHDLGTTRYSVQGVYSMHQKESDDSANMNNGPFMHGTTPTIFELINGGSITDGDLEDLYGGSIEFGDGTVWSNVYSAGSLAGSPDIYVVQNGSKVTAFWAAGHIDVLIKTSVAGALTDSGLLEAYARKYGYSYANYQMDCSAGGRNVAPLSTLADATTTAISSATAATYSDITLTFGTTSHDLGEGGGAGSYRCEIDCAGRTLDQVYAYTQYLTRDVSAATLNGTAGWKYQKANSAYTANAAAPFGTYAGGFWNVAQGVWLTNYSAADTYNFVLTDHAGATHQLVAPTNQSVTVSGATAGSRIQIYDTTSSTELYNGTPTFPYTWSDVSAAVADRAIRLRVSYVSGATAKTFIEASIGTCGQTAGTKDISYLVSQTNDATYIANAIDGSTVTGITITPSPARVKISLAGGTISWPEIYAYQVYWLFGATGIADEAAFITAPDTANYLLTGFDLRNDSATPLTITGGWGRDSTTLTVAGCIDVAGSTGNIYPEPDHVVGYATGSGLTAGQAAELSAAASSSAAAASSSSTAVTNISAVPTAVWASGTRTLTANPGVTTGQIVSALEATTIPVNIEKVHDIAVTGSGTALDPWGP